MSEGRLSGAQTGLFKIYQLLQDILDYLRNSNLLVDVINYTYRTIICAKLGGRDGESLEISMGRSDALMLVIRILEIKFQPIGNSTLQQLLPWIFFGVSHLPSL